MPLATPPIPKQDDPRVDFLRESVTAGDVVSKVENNVIHVMIPFGGEGAGWGQWGIDQIQLPPNPPPYWTFDRDYTLRSTVHKESFWAGAIGIAISKIAAMGFEIKGDVPIRVKRGQEILLYADGRQTGYVNFISKHLRDYLTTDNGAFFEVVRDGNSYMSKVLGIRHLDSTRCIRTGDPITPIVYRDRRNQYHELKFYEVVCIADMPNPGETFNGTGLCAASRAYFSIYKLASIEWYLREKVGGLQPLAIHVVNGILDQQLKDAIQAAKEGALARGVVAHMGAVLIGVPSDQQPALVTIPLAELPDGFNRREEFDLSILAYANAIGLDPQDLQPLTGAPLGSGMQTEILHEKSKGRGLAGWRPQFVHQINEFVLSQGTTFTFYDKDFRDLKAQADLSKALADTSAARINAGITTPQQELQVLVDKDELPKEFLDADLTAGETLSDTEKPDEETPEKSPAAENPPAQPPAPKQAEPETAQTEKAFDYEAFKDEIDGAQDIFEMIEAGVTTLKALTRNIKREEDGKFASYGGGKALPTHGENGQAPANRRAPKQADAAGRDKPLAPGNAPGGASADDRDQEDEDGKPKRHEKRGLSKTLKHLAGKHDQKRHAWR